MSIVIDGIVYGLSAADLLDRRGYINASEAPTICGGDTSRRLLLWQEKTGQIEPEDLSGVLPVVMGSVTESLNRAWFEKVSGLTVTDRGRIERAGHLRCTLDGMTVYQDAPCVWEAKHIGAFSKIDDAVQRYMPQVFMQMHLTGTRQAILSVLHGTQGYEWVHVEWDDAYAAQVLAMVDEFWMDVTLGQPPHDAPALTADKPSAFKPYDMTGNNGWAASAADWLANQSAAKTFDKAVKALKELVPADASECTGYGIAIKRAKNGALSIKAK